MGFFSRKKKPQPQKKAVKKAKVTQFKEYGGRRYALYDTYLRRADLEPDRKAAMKDKCWVRVFPYKGGYALYIRAKQLG